MLDYHKFMDATFDMSRNETLVIEWHRVVLETPLAGALVSDIYI